LGVSPASGLYWPLKMDPTEGSETLAFNL
jgi:hypothetical protein